MTYRVGELTERITLSRKQLAKDGAGGYSETYVQYATLWALVRPMSGREREQAMRQEGSALYLVVIHNRDDILDSDVITWRGKNLNIRFPKNRGPRSRWLELEAEIGARV